MKNEDIRHPVRLFLLSSIFHFSFFIFHFSFPSSASAAPTTIPHDASPIVRQVFTDTQWLAGFDSRVVGTNGHNQASAELLKRLGAMKDRPGVTLWQHRFSVVMPRTVHASLQITAGESLLGSHEIYPIWPASVRANTTPRDGIEGELIYVGQGDYADLLPRSLPGQIAVMEMKGSGANWQNPASFGARAIVLLGSDEDQRDAHAHLTRLPLNVPRFYVPAGPAALADALRRQLQPLARRLRNNEAIPPDQVVRARLQCTVQFAPCPATNYYVLVNPAQAARAGQPGQPGQPAEKPVEADSGPWTGPPAPALVVAAAYDSMSIVPNLAPGADAAVDASLVLALLERYSGSSTGFQPVKIGTGWKPVLPPVLFAFIDAFAINQVGVREMLAALAATERDREDYVAGDQRRLKDYDATRTLVDELVGLPDGGGMARLHERKYVSLHRYVDDEVARQVVNIQTQLDRLRLKQVPSEEGRPGFQPGKPQVENLCHDQEEALNSLKQRYYAAQNQLLGDGRFNDQTRDLAGQLWAAVCDRVRGQWSDVTSRLTTHQTRRDLRWQVMGALGRDPAGWTPQQRRQWAEKHNLLGWGGWGKSAEDVDADWCRTKMDERRIDHNAIAFLLGLDLSDAAVAVGPRLFCAHQKLDENGSAKELTNWLKAATGDGKIVSSLWPGREQRAVDLTPLTSTQAPDQFSVGEAANLTSVAPSFGVPAMTWATINCMKFRVDTPHDRAELLDWHRLAPQIDATVMLLDRLIGDPGFHPAPTSPLWSRVGGVVVDQSPGEPVPRVPMRDYLVTLLNGYTRGGQQFFHARAQAEGVRMDEYILTGADGLFYFDALPANSITGDRGNYALYNVQAYQVDDDGDIVRAVDLNKVGKGVRLDINITERNPALRRAVVFSCGQVTVLGLFDPRFLLNLPYGTLLDARRAGRPQKLNFALNDGQMCALLESGVDMHWQALLRAGSTDNRMALINMMDPAQARAAGKSPRDTMRGFPLDSADSTDSCFKEDQRHQRHLRHLRGNSPTEVSAWDFYNLDELRIQDYAEKGLKSEAINDLHQRTGRLLGQATTARDANDGQGLYSAASAALSNEVRVYQAVRNLANDVVRAAIFLLLALAPFAFAMERLLFASPRVYRQLGGILGIFAIMTAILWSFHPAFKISSQPLMIIMAFAIIFMSLLVMSIVYQRFKSQLEEMRSGRAESAGARTSRGGLALAAVRLGIANMRKRKLRTALTGTTVVLITFALLCFTSVSSYMGSKERRLSSGAAPYTGLLIRQPQQRVLPGAALAVVRSAVGDQGTVPFSGSFGKGDCPPSSGRGHFVVVPQYWWCSPLSPDWRLHVSAAGSKEDAETPGRLPRDAGTSTGGISASVPVSRRPGVPESSSPSGPRPDVAVHAALGLAPGEERISGIDRIVGPENWRRFVEGGRPGGSPGCFLAAETAEELAVRPGDTVLVAGVELELLATYTPAEMKKVRSMTGESIMPINYSALGEEQRALLNAQDQDQMSQEVASGVGLEADQPLPPLSAADVIILPAAMMAGMPHCTLRNIGVAADSLTEAREAANEMASRVAFPIYFGSGSEVHVLAATALEPKGPKSLMIMLVIAGLIIFNTMLNSIAERKKEIHIYSSLGLAPVHIGVLFLAEAATYGLMGSIFGYVVGQGIATALAHLHLLGGVTLNYSGTQAIATMALVIGVTVLSALVPAYMAGKLAAPSDTMKWIVPKPVDDVIADTLPFTVTRQTANGVAMFLHDYLDAHREGSIGHFSTDNLRLSRQRSETPGRGDAETLRAGPSPAPASELAMAGVLAVEATIWLAPYDLGVRQEVRLTIVPAGQEEDVLQIDVQLRRQAGQASSWWKLNRVFLGDLRRQLLGWRKLKTARILEYIAAGEKALAEG